VTGGRQTDGDGCVHPRSTRASTRASIPTPTRGGGRRGYVRSVYSKAAASWTSVTRPGSADAVDGTVGMRPMIDLVRTLVLVMVLVTVPFGKPHPGAGTAGTAVAVTLGLSVASWIFWLLARSDYRLTVAALAIMGATGGVLAGVSSLSTAIAVGCVVTSSAGVRLRTDASMAITAGTVAAFVLSGVLAGAPAEALAGYPAALVGLWAFGLTRREYLLRAEQAERALEQARRAHAAENQAGALAERARIAREIHDVLAHSLAAVSVNLQAAEGLLGELPPAARGSEVVKALECIERAVAFTRGGMAETRRAILALRESPGVGGAGTDGAAGPAEPAVPAVPRLAEQIRALTQEYRADGDMTVDFHVTGEARPVGPEAGLTAFRTAQEALTNARKHAPGQPVSIGLEFTPADVTVRIANPLPPADDSAGPLAQAGTGYGLTGLRERAALGGGTLAAGSEDGQWQVRLRIPT